MIRENDVLYDKDTQICIDKHNSGFFTILEMRSKY